MGKAPMATCAAVIAALAAGADANIQTQVIGNSTTMAPHELVANWGGTPLLASPSLALGSFDTRSGDRTLLDVEVYARVTFSNILVDVLNVSQLEPGPMVATNSSGFGATIGNQYVLMDPINAWASDEIDPESIPNFGFINEIELSFSAVTELSGSVDPSVFESGNPFDVYVSALLDARTLTSIDGSLIAITETNPVSDWELTIDIWAEYTYSELPAPGTSALGLVGMGLLATRRRR